MSQISIEFGREIIVDLFAGGGGASLGIEQAFGRPVDICVNHDADAVAMHAANHPLTQHLRCDVFEVDPVEATGGRQVGLLWASPDCKHFSKAKGGKPRSKKIRALAWVVVKWADQVRPRIIMLENVEEFITWGPLAKNGQPCPNRKGATFGRWIARLRALGYVVEWKELRACDYGAPTIRKRFFLVARCDGAPIIWPKPTHGKPDSPAVVAGKLLPWRTAAECIDWSQTCPSIFLTPAEARVLRVKRPLAEATMKRIAKGIDRFVLDTAKPFIVPIQNYGWGDRCADIDDPLRTVTSGPKGGGFALANPFIVPVTHPGDARIYDLDEPVRTITGANRGEQALVAPVLAGVGGRAGQSGERTPAKPYHTTTAKADTALISAFLTRYRADSSGSGESGGNPPLAIIAAHMEQANTGVVGHAMTEPVSTIVGKGCTQRLVASSIVKLRGDNVGSDVDKPLHTISAQGTHHAEVRAFLIAYYGNEKDGIDCNEPMRTVVSRERFGLVTVDGADYAIADIGLRMLMPRELFRAQGFPDSYIIDRGVGGRKLPKDAQVRACGNSVCPPMAKALVQANVADVERAWEVAA
jgi:DNA (cytosine-5)-methyltransferase 1